MAPVPLSPSPGALELHSPGLGVWFSTASGATLPVLPLPADDTLSLAMTINAGVSWRPPASGTLSFHFVTDERRPALAGLRDGTGAPAFTTGSFVALFTLLPWVERRIDVLIQTNLPSLAAAPTPLPVPVASTTSTRPMVRSFALELTTPPTNMTALNALLWSGFVYPAGVGTPEEQAAHLGLKWEDGVLGNGAHPMSDLVQPGAIPATGLYQELLAFTAATTVNMWTFDHRGRPVDPGAVAAWWAAVAGNFTNMWADPTATRTAATTAGTVIHLVNSHEGALSTTAQGRLNAITGFTGSGVVRTSTVAPAAPGVTVGFTAAPADPTPDALPQPAAAVLPDGRYGATAIAWPAGPIGGVTRDYCRFGVMSIEHELVGQQRTTNDTADAAVRRAGDQDREATRIFPGRAMAQDATGTFPALLAGTEAILAAVAAPPGATATTVLASVADRDAGPVGAALPAVAVPATAPTLSAQACDGGGSVSGPGPRTTALDQRVLLTVTEPTAVAGTWVRAWPLGFDHDRGEHIRLDGGAAPFDGTGTAQIVMALPDGTVDSDDPTIIGVDVLYVTATNQALFTDLRVARPFPTTVADPIDLADLAVGDPLLIVSTAAQLVVPLPAGSVPSGSDVVALGAAVPAIVDRSTIPAAALGAGTLINQLGAADEVHLTQPAFATQLLDEHSIGDPATDANIPPVGTLSETGAVVEETDRQAFGDDGFWTPGFPYPGLERLEVVVSRPPAPPGGFGGAVVVGSTPLLDRFHELPRHDQAHPGCPAAPEVHGNGTLVTGTASIGAVEYVRDRANPSTFDPVGRDDLIAAANVAIPDPLAPAAPSLWMATLRTEAAGMAGDIAWDVINDLLGDPFPFDGTWEEAFERLFGTSTTVPPTTATDSVFRAVCRRVLVSMYGAREGATAIAAAIAAAEDFVYIETPAFDHLTLGRSGDELSLWQGLMDRMDAVPSLRVAVCAPQRLLPGVPEPLQRIRDQAMLDALTAMSAGSRADRFVAFSPAAGPARALRIASTTVIVDDVVAIVGTTHLWRRGLSFDSSLAVATTDELLLRGRPQAVVNFRAALMAAQLNLGAGQLPLDPSATIRAIRTLVERGGLNHLAAERIRPPDPSITTAEAGFDEMEIWNPDGSFETGDPSGYLVNLQAAVYDDLFNV